MKVNHKIILIFILLGVFLTASATTIIPLKEGFFAKIWRCKWHISCYQTKFGATITTIAGTDTISSSRTTINTNFTNLNSDKMEVSTTSVASITTLSNLSSVGTLTVGVWSGTAIAVGKGGTGTTSPSIYQVLLGNGANGLTVASSTGTTGQFLTSNGNGAYPSWQTSSVDQGISYNWTAHHIFSSLFATKASSTNATTTNFTTTSLTATNSTTTSLRVANTASTTDLYVSGTCVGCISGYEATSSATTAGPTAQGAVVQEDVFCSSGKKVLGGGINFTPGNLNAVQQIITMSYPLNSTTWRTEITCSAASCTAGNFIAYAICGKF